jgi:Kef-type K+ transport system membrane component KefB
MTDAVVLVAHVLAVLAVVLLVSAGARWLARCLRQPGVVGEIAIGLLIGPALLTTVWPQVRAVVLPAPVMATLSWLGQAALILFLVGVAHELCLDGRAMRDRAVAGVTVGSLLPSLAVGALLAGWLLAVDDPQLRGTAPTAAFVLMLAIAMSVSAVPVLARILVDRGSIATRVGQLSLTAAVVIDAVAWLALAVVIGITKGGAGGVVAAAAVMVVGLAISAGMRWVLSSDPVARVLARLPSPLAAVVVGTAALVAAVAAEDWGLTAIFGAFAVGLMIPTDAPRWERPIRLLSTLGGRLVPIFFVATGLSVWAGPGGPAWLLVVVATAGAVVAKIGGGWLFARWAGEGSADALQLGVLLNTRGLTEIALLQAGATAGVLTSQLYLALLMMALVTTAMTGPVLDLIERFRPAANAIGTAGSRFRGEPDDPGSG